MMGYNIDHPLRLAVGSHQAGSGKGCAMNLVSWENGDTTITDLPGCVSALAEPYVLEQGSGTRYVHGGWSL